ncbi:hypothetical protein [Geobacillus subterraneus]|uniref:hypothetical protein n=1 Tax=Geobacillus subterraneus TaxID=129338 RepID=UPI00161324D6
MSEEILLQLVDRLGHIENTLHLLVESHKRLEAEQQEIRKEQGEIGREQQEIRKEQEEFRRIQQALLKGQKRLGEEQAHLKAGQKELYDFMSALLHPQDETDAALKALAMNVHKLHGEVSSIHQRFDSLEKKVDAHVQSFPDQLNNVKLDIAFLSNNVIEHEREIYKIKNVILWRKADGPCKPACSLH